MGRKESNQTKFIIRLLINVQVHWCRGIIHISRPLPGNWLGAHIVDLTPDLQVAPFFLSQQSFSISFFHVSLGSLPPPPACHQSVYHMLTVPLERSTCPNQQSLSIKMRLRSSSLSFASSSLDLTVATCILWLTLWLDTADLSEHGPVIALQVRLGQWPSFTGMALPTQELYTWPPY